MRPFHKFHETRNTFKHVLYPFVENSYLIAFCWLENCNSSARNRPEAPNTLSPRLAPMLTKQSHCLLTENKGNNLHNEVTNTPNIPWFVVQNEAEKCTICTRFQISAFTNAPATSRLARDVKLAAKSTMNIPHFLSTLWMHVDYNTIHDSSHQISPKGQSQSSYLRILSSNYLLMKYIGTCPILHDSFV